MSNTTKKRWGDRKDARWIRDMDSLHVILPHLMNHRTDAEVYVNMEFDVTEALRYIARKNEGEEEYRASGSDKACNQMIAHLGLRKKSV